jgi:protein TonB
MKIQKNKFKSLLIPLTVVTLLLSSAEINNVKAGIPQDKIYSEVDQSPTFQGGMDGFSKFLAQTVKYPAQARQSKIQGRVFVSFVVEKDGSLTNVKAVHGPGHGLNEEAERAIKTSPKWTPGKQNGKAVRVSYTVPINFTLAPSGAKG